MSWIVKLPLRIVNAVIGWFFYWMETATDGVVGLFAKKEYRRKGSCKRCGRCCTLLALEMPDWISRRDRLVHLVNAWHDAVLNLEFKGRDGRWLIYSCRYYRKRPDGTAACAVYPFRHRLCRFYPHSNQYGHPKLHTECGFSFVCRDGMPSFDDVMREARRRGA